MNGSAGPRTKVELALASVVTHLASHLRDSSVDRSKIEDALESRDFSTDLRDALRVKLDQALHDARVEVREDVVDLDPWPALQKVEDSTASPGLRPETDPIAAARRRLEMDRQLSPSRLQNHLLSAEEEVGLTLLARPDGAMLKAGQIGSLVGEAREAAEAMVSHNLRLAHSVSRSFQGQGLEYDDLYASAAIGLLRAVERFDPAAGFKFSTYATHWLRQAISRAIANESRAIRIPVHMWETIRKVEATRERMTVDGKRPSSRVLAEELHVDVPKVVECLRLLPAVLSLETPLGNDQFTLGDLVVDQRADDEHMEVHGLFREDVESLLGKLDSRSAEVMRMRFGLAPYDEPHTLGDIGAVFGVTRERIRQIESKAYESMRGGLRRLGYPVPAAQPRKSSRGASSPQTAHELVATCAESETSNVQEEAPAFSEDSSLLTA